MRAPVLVLFVLIAGLMPAFSVNAEVQLVYRGEARAVVVTADAPSPTAAYAAGELVGHVERATGVRLDVAREADAAETPHTRVYVGATQAALRLGIDPERLPREAHVVRTVGNDLFIVGREDAADPLDQRNPQVGTLFGVYAFLDTVLGVRWLWPGPLGTYVPRTDTITVPAANALAAPALQFRQMYWGGAQAMAEGWREMAERDIRLGFTPEGYRNYAEALRVLLRRHQMGGLDAKIPTGHAFTGWWERYGEAHPEWFMMSYDGQRGHPDRLVEMCVSNEELQDFIVAQWDGESVLRLGPVDRPGRCACAACRAWDGPQPDPAPWFARMVYETERRAHEANLFAGATSDRYARFWKTIQQKAAMRNPEVIVSASFLFENEFPAPVLDIHLGRNIYAEFVQWQDPHLRWFPMPEEAFAWIQEQWLGWQKTGMRMGYRPNYLHDGYVMPHFDTRQSGNFFKFAHAHGMEGASFDSLTGQWAMHGLRLYLHLRLMNRPDLTVEEVRDEYFAAFGPAAETMRRYHDYWEDYAIEHQLRFIELYRDAGWRYRVYPQHAHEAFPPASFTPARDLLAQALTEAQTEPQPEYAERVRFVQTGIDHALLTLRLLTLFDSGQQVPGTHHEAAQSALKELIQFRKAHEHLFFADLEWVTSFWERQEVLDLDALIPASSE